MKTSVSEELGAIQRLEDARARLGELANLGGPASAAVTRRAIADPQFGFYLMFTKDAPAMQRKLLDDARNAEYERAEQDASAASLVGNAVKAFARWGSIGFRSVDDATYAERWSTCQACPKLVEAPDRTIYQGLTLLVADRRVCAACGCAAAKKAKVPTERCPLGKWTAVGA